ncbi:MAG: lamin tail domain-containing protein [Lewinellaceae bacterium]|nr:lamin tail domain-containing protein [Lewinellaceae bacterium]
MPNAGDVVINEFLADNGAGATDEAGENEDWLELYNNTATPVNLTGLYLTDKADNPTKWPFPAGVSIPGNGFLIVWLDEDQLQGPYHANFKLSAGGEFIMLSDGAGTVLDSLSFGPQQPDISFGRYPNGVGPFTFMPVTFDDFNSTTSTQSPERAVLALVPNPASDACTLQSDAPLGRVQVLIVWVAWCKSRYRGISNDSPGTVARQACTLCGRQGDEVNGGELVKGQGANMSHLDFL